MIQGKTQLRTLAVGLIFTFCVTGGFSIPAYAAKGGHGHGYHSNVEDNNKDSKNSNRSNARNEARNEKAHDRARWSISNEDRQTVRNYLKSHHRAHCPPGLAKKNNGCLPPGQARKYQIGKPLPPGVTYVAVPPSLERNLRPLQPGYKYVQVEDDVLLLSKKDQMVIDAVTLLTNLAQ